jgi:hypothetical protein
MNALTKYDRKYKGSLYERGYSDGYAGRSHDPHWIIIDEHTNEKTYVTSAEDIEEYDQGYRDGKFHFSIDSKKHE